MPQRWPERYCAAPEAQCARTAAAQALQLLLLVTSTYRARQLMTARPPRRANASFSTLLALHALLAMAAAGLAATALTLLLLLRSTRQLPPALLVTSSLDAAAWAVYASLLWLEHKRARGRQSEPVLLLVIFVAIYDLLGVLYDDDIMPSTSSHLARIAAIHVAVVTAVAAIGVLRKWIHWRSFEYAAPPSDTFEEKLLAREDERLPRCGRQQATSPLDRAGFLSRIAYWWISPFITLGIRRRFEVSDVPELPARDATDTAARVFKRALEHELRSRAPSFLRVTRRLYGAEVLFFAAWSTLNKLIGLASPVLIKLFLDWADEKEPSLSKGYWLAAAMVARSVLAAVSGTQYSLAWKRFDIRVRAGVISAIYDRSLSLSSSAKRRYGLGRITNLISVDLGRLVGMPGTVFDMFLIPAEIVIALVLLSREVSYAFVAGVAVLGVMLPIQTLLGGKIQSVTKSMLKFRDTRVNITAESLKAIKALKLLAWVDVQLQRMDAYRQLEMGRLAVRKYLDALCVFFWASTPVIVQTSVFAAVVYSGHDITAANAFTAVSLLDRLIFPMNYFPWIINGFLEARVSALRIREFLFVSSESESFIAPHSLPPSKVSAGTEPPKNVVEISDCIFTWGLQGDDESDHAKEEDDAKTPLMHATEETALSVPTASAFELSIEHLFLKQNRDYVVCGPVGAGKSSLLLALLGEMRRQSGEFSVLRRRAAYAPQTPWLFRGSVRHNITLCDEDTPEHVDEALYRHVLQVCELEQDLREKPQFDRAQVGENGSNFSGGQRLRINLARALYQRTGLYLLDDPFSGLDSRTATKIVKNCFGSSVSQREKLFPQGATVVLVTHSLQLLDLFPREVEVIVMESGEIIESGSYEALTAPGSATRLEAMVSEANRQRQNAQSNAGDSAEIDGGSEIVDSKVASDTSGENPVLNEGHGDIEKEDHTEEHRESGVVNLRVWKAYASSIGWPLSLTILLSIVVMQVSRNGLDWWIGVYTNSHSVSPRVFADTLLWITFVNCTAVFFRSFLFAFGGLSAARSVYARLVMSIFSAALSFFDATPVGRILNRLSGDTYSIDESLPFILNIFLKDLADVLGALVILFYGNKFVLLLLVPLSVFYFRLQQRYRPAARHIRRLDSVTQSPILNMFTETLEGLHVIRAVKLQHEYAVAYGRCLNLSQRMSFLGANTGAWFGIRLDMLGVCVTSFVAISAVAEFHVTGAVNPGILGLTLTYALPIVSKLNAVLGSFIDTEQQMIAVERVKEYTDLPDEESVVSNSRKAARHEVLHAPATSVSSEWPRRGEIEVLSLTVSYTAPGSARSVTALSGISCKIGAGEKVGVCGRTGAGKSTFLNAIFRAVMWKCGSVLVDGVNLEALSLRELRSKLTYIPQEIVLFSGSIRSNLDPEDRFEDHLLWAALAKCGLDTAVAKLARGLESPVESGDATLSKGQSQLLCIARALLRPSKVLCIDEATASIDLETEQLVAKTIEKEFAGSTVVIVAHRIQTIMGCRRVLVFDHGKLAETGSPRELADDPSSMFHGLINSGSDATLL